MGRPKARPPDRRSRMAFVRLREQEWAGFQQFAERVGEKPSRILRRMVREALTGKPDYFKDELVDLKRMCRELAAIGRNLNQLAYTANQGEAVDGEDVRRVINAGIVQMEAVRALYLQAERTTVKRAVGPLTEAGAVPRPAGEGGG